MTKTAFYPGSFDPPTLGHLDIISRGVHLVDHLIIGVGAHPGKNSVFSAAERVNMLERACSNLGDKSGTKISVMTYDKLSVDAVRSSGATIILRGLRNGTDLDYEGQLAGMNRELANDVETVFLLSSAKSRHITATLVRQIASMGGDVSSFVPQALVTEITEKFLSA